MDLLLRDLRFAVRNLRKHPTFSTVAIVTIALGIGANTAIFSVVNAVLLQDLPYDAPEELVRIWSTNMERGVPLEFMSPPDIADYQDQNRTFTDVAAYSEAELAMIDRNESAIKVTGTWAGDNLFSVLGGGPGMGDDLEVKVLPEPGRRDRREAQGVRREACAERSVERTRESTNRNRIRGAADRGERTTDREAPATKGKRRRSGDCAGKVIVLTRGGLA